MDRSSATLRPMAALSEPSATSNATPAMLALAATALGLATWDAAGTYTPTSIRWLAVCIVAAVAGLLAPFIRSIRNTDLLPPALLACAGAQFAALLWNPIDYPVGGLGIGGARALMFLLCAAAVLSGSMCGTRSPLGKWALPIMLLTAAALGLLLLRRLPLPGIDVLLFQQQSCDALMNDVNPYTITFPDPYNPVASARFYGPGLSVNGVLQFGYPYMPLTLLMALPGYLMGDVRYASLICMVLAAALIGYARRGSEGKAAAALLAFTPIAPLVLVLAWTESYVLLLLALTWFCHRRLPKLLPYAFGLLLVSKQYMPAMAPLALLLLPRPWSWRQVWDFAWKAALVGAAVTLPLVLWDPVAFWNSAIMLQMRQPYRPDSLSFLIWANPSDPAKWLWLPFAALFATMATCLAVAWRKNVSFPLALALCLLAFFALNKQAFANYYYLVIGALWCGVVAGADSGGDDAGTPGSARMCPSAGSTET